ncbi:MAG: hypothetical protein HRU15_10035 [Planctomycetes bacterium]|nr:hypothetical protein [Planctomycetota bacterium]
MAGSLSFFSAFLKNRQQIGAVVPSGPSLSKGMIKALGPIEEGKLIIELGPGTGVFTKRLVDAYPNNPIMSIEFGAEFIGHLQQTYPRVHVIQGCASHIIQHLDDHDYQAADVGGLISGLPLLSLPEELRNNVWASIAEVLSEGQMYVQFTYSKRAWRAFNPPGMELKKSKRIIFNIPPAVILPFCRQGS